MHKFLLATLAALLLAPLAQGHSAATPIEAEDHVLQDEWTDNGVWDGFDILDVYIREAEFDSLGAGIVVRWSLYGGSSAGYVSEHMVTLDFDNAQSISWTSTDNGQTWSGPGQVMDVAYDPEEGLPIVNLQFQGFVPYEALGVDVGGSLDNAVATAYAEGLVVDAAPGGYHLYGVEIDDPTAAPESVRLIDSLVLDGPDRYTKSNVTVENGMLTVDVANLIAASGQHVFLRIDVNSTERTYTIGNDTMEGGAVEIEPGQDVTFGANLGDFGVARIDVQSDLGGLETFWVLPDGTVSNAELDALPPAEIKDTPVAPVALLLVALAFLARRR